LPSGEKTQSAAADHARAKRIADNFRHIHKAGLADVTGRDQHDREQVHSAQPPPKFLNKRQVLELSDPLGPDAAWAVSTLIPDRWSGVLAGIRTRRLDEHTTAAAPQR